MTTAKALTDSAPPPRQGPPGPADAGWAGRVCWVGWVGGSRRRSGGGGAGRRGGRDRPGCQQAVARIGGRFRHDNADEVHAAERDERPDFREPSQPRTAVPQPRDRADRDPRRVVGAAEGHEAVARLHPLTRVVEREQQLAGALPVHLAQRLAALQPGADVTCRVTGEPHDRGRGADAHRGPDQPVGVDDEHARPHAGVAAGVDGHGPLQAQLVVGGHDPGRDDRVTALVGHEAQSGQGRRLASRILQLGELLVGVRELLGQLLGAPAVTTGVLYRRQRIRDGRGDRRHAPLDATGNRTDAGTQARENPAVTAVVQRDQQEGDSHQDDEQQPAAARVTHGFTASLRVLGTRWPL